MLPPSTQNPDAAGDSRRAQRRVPGTAAMSATIVVAAASIFAAGCQSAHGSSGAAQPVAPPRVSPATTVNSAPGTVATPAVHTPTTEATPNHNGGTFAINRKLYSDPSLVLTLTEIQLNGDGQITATVTYHNVGDSPVKLQCAPVSDPSIDILTLADGVAYGARNSYCSDHPDADFTLASGETSTSYATFVGVHGSGDSLTFMWQQGSSISGSVDNVVL